ncbi:MAG: PAS domain S-box protein [Syntrophaceae bacterium]|nr:PAS domain S-box protein [Syntrophaceae bacterium]
MKKIMVVDDEEQNRIYLQTLFQSQGFTVITAVNGAKALEAARKDPPHIIISDALMPVMDGFMLCREWKKDDRLKKIPFVFYTATYTDPKDEKLALEMGADLFIIKPQEPDILLGKIKEVMTNITSEEKEKKPVMEVPEKTILKEYNEALFRKLEKKISQLEKARQAIENSEKKYRELIKYAPAGIYEVDYETNLFKSVNDVICEYTGYTREELLKTNFYNLFTEDSRKLMTERLEKLVAGEKDAQMVEYCIRTKDGEKLWILMNAQYIYEEGKLKGATGIVYDITERKKADESLKESELKLRTIYNSTAEGILVAQIQGDKFIQANKAICEMLGYTEEELLKLGVADIHPKKSLPHVINEFYKLVRREMMIAHDIPLMRKDKTVSYADISSSPISLEGKEYLIGIFRDATERRKTEEILRERDLIFKKLSANVPGMIYQFERRPDGRYCVPFTTEAVKSIFGCSPEDVANDFSPIIKAVYHEDLEKLIRSIEDSATHMTQWQCEYRVQLPGKPVKWLYGTSTPEKLPDGSIIWHGFNTDITERKKDQEELQKSEENFRLLAENAPDAIFIRTGPNFVYANKAALKLFGADSPGQLIGQPVMERYHPDYREGIRERMHLLDEKKEAVPRNEQKYLKLDGTVIDVEVSAVPFRYGEDAAALVFVRDITERKRTEEMLTRNRELLEEMGRITLTGAWEMEIETGKQIWTGETYEIFDRKRNDYDPDTAEAISRFEPASQVLINNALKEAITQGVPFDLDFEMTTVKDNRKWIRIICQPVVSSGRVIQLKGTVQDITERRRVGEALRESQRFSLSTIDALSVHICVMDETGRIVTVNRAWRAFANDNPPVPANVCEGANYLSICDAAAGPDAAEAAAFAAGIRAVIRGERADFSMEYPCHSPDKRRWFVGRVTRFAGEGPVFVVVAHENITERKQVENELRISERRYRMAETIGHVGNWEYNLQTAKFWGSDEAKRIYGFDPAASDFSTEEVEKCIPGRKWVHQALVDLIERGKPYDLEFEIHPKNSTEPVIISSVAELQRDEHGQPFLVKGVIQDITRRKHAEELVQIRMRLMNFAMNHALDEVLQKTLDEIAELTGSQIGFYHFVEKDQKTLSLQMWSTRTLQEFCTAEGKGQHYGIEEAGVWVDCVHQRRPVIHNDYATLSHRKGMPKGHADVVRELVVPVMRDERIVAILGVGNKPSDYGEKDIGIVAYLADVAWEIAEHKRAEDALRRSEERFKAQYHGSSIPTYTWQKKDDDFVLVDFNSAAETATDGKIRKYLHKAAGEMYRDRQDVLQNLHRCFEEKVSIKKDLPSEHFMPGKYITVTYSFVPNDLVLVQAEDITDRKRMEEELRESEEKFRAVFENSAAAIALINPDETIEDVNKAYLRVGGYTRDKVLGKSWTSQVVPEDLERMKELNRRRLRGERELPAQYEFGFVNEAGEKRAAWISVATIPPTGKIVASFVDITDRKRAEEEIKKLASIVRFSSELVNLTTLDGKMIFLNEAGSEMLGIAQEKVGNYSIMDVISEKYLSTIREQLLPALHAGKDWKGELQYRNIATGRLTDVYATTFNIRDEATGKVLYLANVSRDITEYKHAEEDIRKLNVELEDRVRQRTAELSASNKELESFSYSVSHDLRAPLRHIIGFSEILQNTAVNLDEKGLHCLNNIIDSTKRMGELIDDLLSFSRMGRVELRNAGINTEKLVRDVIKELSEETQGRNIVWDIHPLPAVTGDAAMLRIVFINLIANAVKFTRLREETRITIGNIPSDDRETVFFVRDNGVGFDMKYVDKLFGVFQRLHSRRDFEGTGIGLANVKRIVERHGGKVWAEGATDSGATFYVSLPKKGGEK